MDISRSFAEALPGNTLPLKGTTMADELTSPAPTNREVTHEEADIALHAYDAGLFLQRGHIKSGIIDQGIARIFAMMDALRAVDDVRRTGTATIHIDETDPAYRAAKEKRDAAN